MAVDTVMVLKCVCERCSHKWITRTEEKPRVCPKCKNPYWNKPKKDKNMNAFLDEDMVYMALEKIDNYLSKIEEEGLTGENKYKHGLAKILKESLENG